MSITKFIIASLILGLSFVSCQKDDPPKATVTVVDNTGAAVTSAKVTVKVGYSNTDPKYANTYVDPNTGLREIVEYTSSTGTASFDFVRPAVLTAYAEYTTEYNGNTIVYTGKGILVLDEGKTFEKTIIVE